MSEGKGNRPNSQGSPEKSKNQKPHNTLGEAPEQDKGLEGKRNELELDTNAELSEADGMVGRWYWMLKRNLIGHEDLYELCGSHLEKFRHYELGNLDDIEKAIKYGKWALNKTPEEYPELSCRHGTLAVCYADRFRRLGILGDLEREIEHSSRALELTPEGHPDLPGWHANLGGSYGDRFRRLGDLDDLKRQIEHKSHALDLTSDGHPDKARRHNSLGVSYTDRFRRLGDLDDLEKSIKHKSRALELTPNGHPDKSSRHSNLGDSYGDRFQRLGDLDDLERSIEHKSRALELTPDTHPEKARRHNSLGISYSDRFRHLDDLDDLEKSIKHITRALELTPDDRPDKPRRHNSLGVSYTDRFRRLGDPDDLEKSIKHKSRALELTPDGHPNKSHWHCSLGVSYGDRFRYLGDLADIRKAIEHGSRALQLTPDEHPDRSNYHAHQAETFLSQYRHTGDRSHLMSSMDSFRKASQLLTGPPRSKFKYALLWASVAFAHSPQSPVCIEAYQTAIDLLPQFVWLGAATSQRYYDLSTAENLAVKAARVAILHSNYVLALEWLEHARCVVWSQTIMLRSPIDELHSSHAHLAERLQAVSRHLHSDAPGPSVGKSGSSSVDPDNVSQDRYHLAREYDHLVTQTRTLPGFEDFLLPMKADRLVLAAQTGPIAVINCHTDQCDALLVLPGQGTITHIPLPSFTEGKARSAQFKLESALRVKGLRERGAKTLEGPKCSEDIGRVLASLWQHIVKPVLDSLGYISRDPSNILPHITWCPTGALSFLPLHAAGDYDQPGSRVFDYVISSYTPTLTALLASAPTALDRVSRVLVIGQTHTPGHSPLPGAAEELELVKARLQNRTEYSALVDELATTTEVLNAMDHHEWVHLACHAHQNISDPTKSGFYLHDGTLDLASISRQLFKNKGLAFLSACQTATGDDKLPDEAIHLASGMLMAGYPSVIATMWSVMDSDAPLIADKVYAALMKDGKVGNGEAGKALHHAVRVLREEVGEKEYVRWVPYIHIGK